MNIYPHLKGRRALIDLRCSTTRQTDTSIPDQEQMAIAFCEANGIIVVGIIRQEGVTASIPGARTDFDEVIERKRRLNDFDLVVLTDITRFTRAGIKHGMSREYQLEVEGIEVVFATTALPMGEDADLIKPAYYFAAKMWAKSLAHSVARGMMSAFESGKMAHCNVPPHGLDFMYIADGEPSHITRLLADGRQLKLHVDAMGKKPRTDQILHTYPRNPKHGKNRHYRRQPNEEIVLVPGDPDALATVIWIFTLLLKENWGSFRIAQELNERGIPAPRGGLWSSVTVDYLVQNKVYLGTGITNMKTRAVYAARNPITPKLRNVSPKLLAQRKSPPLELRPQDEWKERQYPLLLDLLDEELKPLAEKFIERSLAKKAGRAVGSVPKRPRHPNSDYFLSGILRSKQGGHALSGTTAYARGKRYRHYRITKFWTTPLRDPIMRQQIDAERIEATVLARMKDILTLTPNLTKRLEMAVKAEQKARQRDNRERPQLLQEREAIREEYHDLIALGKHGRELARQKIQQCERRLAELEDRIAAAEVLSGTNVEPSAQAQLIVNELVAVAKRLDNMPQPLLKRLAALLVSKLEIDMETLDFEIELALPSWALIDANGFAQALRLEPNSLKQIGHETKPHDRAFFLGRFACSAIGKPICFDCRRVRRAA